MYDAAARACSNAGSPAAVGVSVWGVLVSSVLDRLDSTADISTSASGSVTFRFDVDFFGCGGGCDDCVFDSGSAVLDLGSFGIGSSVGSPSAPRTLKYVSSHSKKK
jgi:hypothetical protein